MNVTFYKEWTNEYGHKFKAGETVELWDARTALRAGVCVLEGNPIPKQDTAEESPAQAEELPLITKTKKGK